MKTLINHRDRLIQEIAEEYDIKKSIVEDIVNHQFKALLENMQSGEFKPIMLHHIGKWYPSKKRKEYWEKKLKESNG